MSYLSPFLADRCMYVDECFQLALTQRTHTQQTGCLWQKWQASLLPVLGFSLAFQHPWQIWPLVTSPRLVVFRCCLFPMIPIYKITLLCDSLGWFYGSRFIFFLVWSEPHALIRNNALLSPLALMHLEGYKCCLGLQEYWVGSLWSVPRIEVLSFAAESLWLAKCVHGMQPTVTNLSSPLVTFMQSNLFSVWSSTWVSTCSPSSP